LPFEEIGGGEGLRIEARSRQLRRLAVALRRTDPKHNKYTMEVLTGGKKTEKREKDRRARAVLYVESAASTLRSFKSLAKRKAQRKMLSAPC